MYMHTRPRVYMYMHTRPCTLMVTSSMPGNLTQQHGHRFCALPTRASPRASVLSTKHHARHVASEPSTKHHAQHIASEDALGHRRLSATTRPRPLITAKPPPHSSAHTARAAPSVQLPNTAHLSRCRPHTTCAGRHAQPQAPRRRWTQGWRAQWWTGPRACIVCAHACMDHGMDTVDRPPGLYARACARACALSDLGLDMDLGLPLCSKLALRHARRLQDVCQEPCKSAVGPISVASAMSARPP